MVRHHAVLQGQAWLGRAADVGLGPAGHVWARLGVVRLGAAGEDRLVTARLVWASVGLARLVEAGSLKAGCGRFGGFRLVSVGRGKSCFVRVGHGSYGKDGRGLVRMVWQVRARLGRAGAARHC